MSMYLHHCNLACGHDQADYQSEKVPSLYLRYVPRSADAENGGKTDHSHNFPPCSSLLAPKITLIIPATHHQRSLERVNVRNVSVSFLGASSIPIVAADLLPISLLYVRATAFFH